jgi:hypothetical protein
MEHSNITNIPLRQSSLPLVFVFFLWATSVSAFSPLKPCCVVSAARILNTHSLSSHSIDLLSQHHDVSNSSCNVRDTSATFFGGFKRRSTETVTRLFPLQRRRTEEEYKRRKEEWASRYTNVDSLRELFGGNQNAFWGDLDANTSRRLYKTLLPKALLELYKVGVRPEDLAPLAYQARVAAKVYARERCTVPSRVMAMAFDGFRSYRDYGKFQVTGMSYDQLWDKYAQLVLEEEDLTEEDVTAKICVKILEKACQTNNRIDKWVLRDPADTKELKEQAKDLDSITAQLEQDVRDLLSPLRHRPTSLSAQRVQTLRMVARAKRRFQRVEKALMKDQQDRF